MEQSSFVSEGVDLLRQLTKDLAKWKLEKLLSGPYDDRGAILSIQVLSSENTACIKQTL